MLTTAATPSKPIPVMRFNIVVTPSGIKIVPVCSRVVREATFGQLAGVVAAEEQIKSEARTCTMLILIPFMVSYVRDEKLGLMICRRSEYPAPFLYMRSQRLARTLCCIEMSELFILGLHRVFNVLANGLVRHNPPLVFAVPAH